jgi:hypothetical protein
MLHGANGAGLAGLIILIAGVGLYITGSGDRLSLLYWLGGPFLCFAGAALLMVAMLWRVYYKVSQKGGPTSTRSGPAG